ncbi:unnamed protein product, partial [Discosporangium mesarthrocarpum]
MEGLEGLEQPSLHGLDRDSQNYVIDSPGVEATVSKDLRIDGDPPVDESLNLFQQTDGPPLLSVGDRDPRFQASRIHNSHPWDLSPMSEPQDSLSRANAGGTDSHPLESESYQIGTGTDTLLAREGIAAEFFGEDSSIGPDFAHLSSRNRGGAGLTSTGHERPLDTTAASGFRAGNSHSAGDTQLQAEIESRSRKEENQEVFPGSSSSFPIDDSRRDTESRVKGYVGHPASGDSSTDEPWGRNRSEAVSLSEDSSRGLPAPPPMPAGPLPVISTMKGASAFHQCFTWRYTILTA